MAIRAKILAAAAAALALLGGCDEVESGPVTVSAIGGPPRLANPNLEPVDQPTAFLLEATAQGLVRFDSTGQIEPALAQSWIVSDDGLRYTFRVARSAQWANGDDVTAEPVAARLQAASSRASRNPLKPLLGAIAGVEAMTEDVLEISLRAPRPHFLQLLAQPQLAIVRNGAGAGPFRAEPREDGSFLLSVHRSDEEEEEQGHAPDVILRGEPAAMAVARFDQGRADLVTGGTMNDLPIARAAEPADDALRFDPVSGLFGLAFASNEGAVADPEVRSALSMAIDRAALVAAMGVPALQPRTSIVPPGIDELPRPSVPGWAATALAGRRATAAAVIAAAAEDDGLRIRVAMPEGPGYRLLFAHLRRDWRAIGVAAERVAETADADLRLIDSVAPANLSTWYLRRFECGANPVCSAEADIELAAARTAPDRAERQRRLTAADRLLMELTPFIPLTAPVRWSLVTPRLTGFQVNPFGRHFAGRLIAEPQ
jgi:oligopeptide transport system substrate-binding protein